MLPSFILRLCKFVFCEAPPPLLLGQEDESRRRRSRAYVRFAKRHPPFARLAGGDEFLRVRFRLRFFARQGLSCLGIFAHEDFLSSNFYLGHFARKDFSALGFSLIRTFMS